MSEFTCPECGAYIDGAEQDKVEATVTFVVPASPSYTDEPPQ